MLCLIINCIQVASPSYSATHQNAGGCQTFPLWKHCFHMLISQPLCETWISLSTPFCLKAPSRARISEILRRCWIIVQCFWGSYLPKKDPKLSLDYPGRRGSTPCSRKGLEALRPKELSLKTDVRQQSMLTKRLKIQGPNKSNMIITANGLKDI